MSQNKWDDDKIENLLSSVPKIKDTRTKDEILQRLKDDGVFDDKPSQKPVTIKKKRNWIPPLIAVAAIALFALMIPSLLNQMDSENMEFSTTSMDLKEESNDLNTFSSESAESEISQDSREMSIMADDSGAHLRTSVYPEDLEGFTVFHIGLISDQVDSIPITVLIPNEQVMEDLGKAEPTSVELYNYYAPLFDEGAIGFVDYHPYKGVISENGNQVIHTLPAGHGYDTASATIASYTGSLIDTFKDYGEVVFLNEDGTRVVFDQVGEESEPLPLHSEYTQFNYFKTTQNDGSVYLSTNGRRSYETVEEALEDMKIEDNDIYQSVILPGVDYTVSVDGSTVTVEFTSQLDLENFNPMEAMQMVEGILLTAASFDMDVKFENVVQTDWGGFDFTNPLPIPVGPNKIPLVIQ
ncbi:hypothetical protein [Ureibacillus acetophenoni]|uniref:Sporulation and spore germination protein n=1 Tax=Ureibacillus acetophenoni TaxID=614649 RepID=A0A285U8D6_9BACL|nr:hypothetical protein [Ureibacillus acetophenoni]SOC38102.1 hypothetical protein SAMN05877842_10420 [Ureibacillus acetophenoni]